VYLARTPAMKPEDHVSTRRTKITISADGFVSGESVQSGTGIFAAGVRSMAVSIQRGGIDRAVEQRLRDTDAPGRGRFELGSLTELGETYSLTAKFGLNSRVRVAPSTSLPIPAGLGLNRPGEFLLGRRYQNRTVPFVCLAGRQVEEVEIAFANGLPLPAPIADGKIENATFTYTAQHKLEGRILKIRREFTSRVAGQVCAPEIEAAITAPLKEVKNSLAARMMFKAEPASPPAVMAPAPPAKAIPAVERTEAAPAATE
jgi:hypothetical protein